MRRPSHAVRFLLTAAFFLLLTSQTRGQWTPHTIALGADLSFVPGLEDDGGHWYDNGVEGDPLDQFADNGWSIIRLRLWHTPNPDGWERYHGLDSTIVYAKRAVAAGHEWMLDFHYSDYWADPGKQWPPAAWEGVPIEFLDDSLYLYTRAVLERCRAEGVMPDYVQLGNEINPGMLWPVGSVQQNTAEQWKNFSRLLKAGELAVRHASGGIDKPVIILHHSDGGNAERVITWVDSLLAHDVPFDMIGLSYYPWWHGTFGDLENTLFQCAYRFAIPMMVVETAYPSTLDWYDDQHNIVGDESQLLPGFPATPEGQAAYFDSLKSIVTNAPGRLGKGLLWWEPAWVSVNGRACGFENLTLYDFEGNALPALHQNPPSGVEPDEESLPVAFGVAVWPNPFNGKASVLLGGGLRGAVRLELFNLLGERVGRWELPADQQRMILNSDGLTSGVYFLRADDTHSTVTRRITLLR